MQNTVFYLNLFYGTRRQKRHSRFFLSVTKFRDVISANSEKVVQEKKRNEEHQRNIIGYCSVETRHLQVR